MTYAGTNPYRTGRDGTPVNKPIGLLKYIPITSRIRFDWHLNSADEKDAIAEIESLKPIFLYTQVEVHTLTTPSNKENKQDMGDGDV